VKKKRVEKLEKEKTKGIAIELKKKKQWIPTGCALTSKWRVLDSALTLEKFGGRTTTMAPRRPWQR
jgi:hypothetical protein